MLVDMRKRFYWHLTCNEILRILSGVAVPIALAIYTAVTYNQEQQQAYRTQQFESKQASESRQQTLYDKFLNNIYKLDKDGYLNNDKNPWAFANAFYRVTHRQWDTVRKGDILQFLKEQKLIGRNNCTKECKSKELVDIICLNELDFDNVHLISQTGTLNQLDLECVSFDKVSMTNTVFSSANLNGVSFDGGRLNNAKFGDTSLTCATFNGIDLDGVDFGNSDLSGAQFINVNLSTAKLSEDQIKQANFTNTIMPSRIAIQTTTTKTTTTKLTTITTTKPSTTTTTTTTTTKKSSTTTTTKPTTTTTTKPSTTTTTKITTSITTTAIETATTSITTTAIETATTSITTTAIETATTSITTTAIETATTESLSLYGVQLNLDPSWLPSEWSLCYSTAYTALMGSSVITKILATCNKNKLLLGCRPVKNTILTVAAMGNRNDVLYNCSSLANCVHVANGVSWYFSNSHSWGFAPGGAIVKRSTCDTFLTNDTRRLCWHTNGSGGHSCGNKTNLNADNTWEKVLYQAN
ncbi:unnamed protein product [Adineta steineri]|uniref:Uncharacterized protein n=1 Tax=Adineta steineri TaxID=433720 RepID=A0A814UHN3_9BILA|nr:unnamed protein product [Adineta steineri]CAF3842694.1 unnamed protein product [Adineta steineri]